MQLSRLKLCIYIIAVVFVCKSSFAEGAREKKVTSVETVKAAEILVSDLSESLTVCRYTYISDEARIYKLQLEQERKYLTDTGAIDTPESVRYSFRQKATDEVAKKGFEYEKCKSEEKSKFILAPKKTIGKFGAKHQDALKKLLVLWEIALDSVGRENDEKCVADFENQARVVLMDIKMQ